MAWTRGLLILQLVGLLVSSMYGNGVSHRALASSGEGAHPLLVKAPPSPPSLKLSVAVEGVVYCMSCKMPGAFPLSGAVARLECKSNLGFTYNGNATTDSKGYFFIQVQNQRPSMLGSCKVVVKAPKFCNKPTIPKSLHDGVPLKFEKIEKTRFSKLLLFNVGFLEFASSRHELCPRQA